MFTTVPANTVLFFIYKSTWRANFCCRLIVKLPGHFLKKKKKSTKPSTSITKQPLTHPSKTVVLLESRENEADKKSICMKVSVSCSPWKSSFPCSLHNLQETTVIIWPRSLQEHWLIVDPRWILPQCVFSQNAPTPLCEGTKEINND